jgi:hypothetical protein
MQVLGFNEDGMIRVTLEGQPSETLVPDDMRNADREKIAEWEAEGNTIPPYVSPPPSVTHYEEAIQDLVDASARSRQFRDGGMLATYVASTNPQWSAEAQAFVAWRDGVWEYAYAELAKVMAGQREQPSIEDFLTEIDPIEWPI